ncbi:MAG TPA: maleylpyruvate isomerase family mycothiol-dependent enzyme [Nocardioidaceae bacterium]|nr:maleylpyruvate isomerase family mycothiol-dependent enzyme [Nocardioidaceae bacterium]
MTSPRRRARELQVAEAYADGVGHVLSLVDGLDERALATMVPACPDWSVHDLVAHLAGIALDATRGRYFDDALSAWQSPELAAARDAWTAGQVAARVGLEPAELVAELRAVGQGYADALRRGDPLTCRVPGWLLESPVADLAVHLDDLREALGVPPEPSLVTDTGFAGFRGWLASRIAVTGLAPLRMSDGTAEWVLGGDAPAGASVVGSQHELFRVISGRRGLTEIAALSWEGDSTPYLAVLSPYPMPE